MADGDAVSAVPKGFASLSVRRYDPGVESNYIPVKAMSLLPGDHVVLNGNPVAPDMWIRADCEVTGDGTYYSSRPAVTDIHDTALVRFVPTDETWLPAFATWRPLASGLMSRYQFDGSLALLPTLLDTDYVIGRELFLESALDFGNGSVLVSDFNEDVDDAYNFTLGMALNVRGPESQVLTFLDGSYVKVTPTGLEAMLDGHVFTVKMPAAPSQSLPLYVVLEVLPPHVYLSAALGPSKIYQGSSVISERTTSFVFSLAGDIELYSLDIWGDDRPTLVEIIAGYASALGSH